EITHVMRGVEYLSSTPKYNLLYWGFGWEPPAYIHLPHIIKESGKKLSKREGDASFQDLLAKGYLPEAIVNYIALLGWSSGDDREFFRMPDLIAAFEVSHINKSKAAFSVPKLDWLNGEHLRQLTAEEFHQHALGFYPKELVKHFDTVAVSRLIQTRVATLSEIPAMTAFLLEPAAYEATMFAHEKSKATLETSKTVLTAALKAFETLPEWTEESIKAALIELATDKGFKTGVVMWPVRISLSGQQFTPGGAVEIAAILGKPEAMKRMQAGLKLLG
ncbi:MAG: glutamate--tRNA ligase, partial [Anaerolineaceae bacterium]|nr:glutamate--tRNA ligase [Anaerolineaceae bacterium]